VAALGQLLAQLGADDAAAAVSRIDSDADVHNEQRGQRLEVRGQLKQTRFHWPLTSSL
jgi:hypothetical protein